MKLKKGSKILLSTEEIDGFGYMDDSRKVLGKIVTVKEINGLLLTIEETWCTLWKTQIEKVITCKIQLKLK